MAINNYLRDLAHSHLDFQQSSLSMGFHSKESDNEHLQNIEQPMFVFRHEQFPFSQGVLALKLQHRIFRTSGVITSTPGGSIVGSNDSSASFRSKPNSDSGWIMAHSVIPNHTLQMPTFPIELSGWQ